MDKYIGVIGAGVMGRGVSQALAAAGHQVVLVDISEQALESAHQQIARDVRFQGMFSAPDPKAKSLDSDEVLAAIHFTRQLQDLKRVTFVVENITEDWGLKKQVYQELDAVCGDDCVYAANTSALSITRIGSVTKRREQVLGMHFMNPVPMKPAVEVIKGFHTSAATLERATSLLGRMGKEAIVVNDSPGFVSNRVLMLTINEAIFLVHEQVASAEDVDRVFKSCFGHKMGPLETGDLIGLDTILLSLEVLYESFNDSKYRPCPLLKKMVDAGLHGRKSGQGFFSYEVA